MYKLYSLLSSCSTIPLSLLLQKRLKIGKELPERVCEKKGIPTRAKGKKSIIWLHAASVGESQSALILITHILKHTSHYNILVTTGTVTSANLMAQNLPHGAFHQFCPLDNPHWIEKFLNYWNPSLVLWMESELWPNILMALKKRHIPTTLINAHMSQRSFSKWNTYAPKMALNLVSSFQKILCQTPEDQLFFNKLSAQNTILTGNLKHSAAPLNYIPNDLSTLQKALSERPVWLYASTHGGEESIASDIHKRLKKVIPNILTIIVPRHPERRHDIKETLSHTSLDIELRGEDKALPTPDTDIYIADTLGELGLFYRLSPIACIGRSFSDDGGGGHNPLEAAQLSCAITHGPHVKNLQSIFDDMNINGAAIRVETIDALFTFVHSHLSDHKKMHALQYTALHYAQGKMNVIDTVMHEIIPILDQNTAKETM